MNAVVVGAHGATSESKVKGLAGKYLTVLLAGEEYALPVLHVREIIKIVDIRPMPQMPAQVRGVINLRGRVIPIIDLRLSFGFGSQEDTEHTCIVVVETRRASGLLTVGFVVDSVSEVLQIAATEIEETPDFGVHVNTDYMKAVAKVKGTVKILLNVDRVLGVDDLPAF